MANGDTTYIHDKKRFSAQLGSIIIAFCVVAGAYHHVASSLNEIKDGQRQQVTVSDFETWIYWVERSNPELEMPSIREVWQIRRDIIRDRRGNAYLGSFGDIESMLGSMIDPPRMRQANETNESGQTDR